MTADAMTPPDHATLQEAAEWFALLRSGEATEHDRAAWRDWLDAHIERREAWQFVEAVSRRFDAFQSRDERDAAIETLRSTRPTQVSRRGVLNALALAAGVGLLGLATWQHAGLRNRVLAWTADYHTGVGDVRAVTLADGTRIWLNTASAFDVDYSSDLRRLRLLAGEVLIDTAKDAARPFVVDTRHGRLRALGTRFTVRCDDRSILLSVSAGAVEIRTGDGLTQIVAAGRQRRFTDSWVGEEGTASAAAEGWINGVLLAEDIPLADLIAELQRYRHGHVSVAPAVASLRVIGGFPLRDPDKTLAMLEDTLPVRVRHTLPWWTVIEAREAGSKASP